MVDASVTTLWRERAAQTPYLADRLGAFADAVPGNCLALFPSFQFLADVVDPRIAGGGYDDCAAPDRIVDRRLHRSGTGLEQADRQVDDVGRV